MAATDGGAGVPEEQRVSADQAPEMNGAGASGLARAGSGAGKSGGGNSPAEPGGPATRASDRERDVVVQRVQDAFAEGRLDDAEFDERTRAALTARTHADLDALLADLPAAAPAPRPVPAVPAPGRYS